MAFGALGVWMADDDWYAMVLKHACTPPQVLTDRSGFGKVASAIGMGWHTVWFGGELLCWTRKEGEGWWGLGAVH
jgi:hypothetical protein